ncbi:hypothetical protein PPL_00194 [Heterostelium album PN500]|uniref:Uncharacterized protein n=1 Tax=Heterostelium pallidum (strain ATCC 26659 / Pp 5 / PN500) TaxID=670386 RepID=D3AVS9_HETP5|nr:hypothetical protein PPL_00194 [Heterostelium album PN500]EFA86402.1 hypothetical protein PPL_00194 [Heterostelium album PN500]|eukprot:XP_020438507.1 hypothetical protein PPL_00194 [Heterostelium album PN500]
MCGCIKICLWSLLHNNDHSPLPLNGKFLTNNVEATGQKVHHGFAKIN